MLTVEKQDTDFGFASSMYQDGLLHALEDIVFKSQTGGTFKEFEEALEEQYKPILERYLKRGNLPEVAYYKGWIEVLGRFIKQNQGDVPPFFHPNTLKPTKVNKL